MRYVTCLFIVYVKSNMLKEAPFTRRETASLISNMAFYKG